MKIKFVIETDTDQLGGTLTAYRDDVAEKTQMMENLEISEVRGIEILYASNEDLVEALVPAKTTTLTFKMTLNQN